MNIAKFSVTNSVLVNLLMIGLFLFGGISLLNMPTELNPEIDFNWVFVTVFYPAASPTETENLIVDKIEAEIQDVEDITEIQSTAGEGFGFLIIKFADMSESEYREHYTDLKAEIDKVEFPEDAEDPIFQSFSSGDFLPVITINMSFTVPEDNAQKIADELEDDLIDLNGVAKVQIAGLAQREIWVEVDPVKLNTLGITFDQIVMALKVRNLNVPGGNIAFGKTEYLIRSVGEYQSIEEIKNTIVKTSGFGDFVKIKDVAEVNDRREEMQILSRLNGEQSITFSISKNSDANSIDVINKIKTLVESYKQNVPDGVEFNFTNDNSVYILRVINILRDNAILGMLLIILVLYVFLGKGNALLAALGIPISFLITFIFMHFAGQSLNGNTLFALVMVLGIIVDDAIIVIENCHRYRLMGFNSFEAAIKGTTEVVTPILSSIGTNIAAFLPLMLLPGLMGKFMRIIPIVFSLALLASMFEAFILLPAHYSDWTKKSKTHLRGEKNFFVALRKWYGHMLIKFLRKRYWLIAGLIVILIFSLSLIPLIGVEMYGKEDFDQFKVLVHLPEGTSLEETDRIMKKFESEAMKLSKSNVQAIITNVGLAQAQEEWTVRKNVGQVIVQAIPLEHREISIEDIMKDLRQRVKNISGPISVQFEEMAGGPPVGREISVKVEGKYFDDIKAAALAFQDSIRKIQGTMDVSDDFPPGKQEIRILVDEDKAAMYGFTTQYVAMNVRYAFDGIEATEFRDGDEEIEVIAKYNESNRSSVDDVLNLNITNALGQTVALREMVNFEISPGPTEIHRFDQKRTIMVVGDIEESVASLDEVNKKMEKLFPKIEAKFPGVHLKIGGQYEEFKDIFGDITSLFILALILMFIILGTQFNSYTQPIIILTTVPFALIGAMLGLIISNNPFSIVAMFGFVALAGIVVNDAIVMMHFVNERRSAEMSKFRYWRSIINSGRLRLRPIILTSLTTISGLLPMAIGLGGVSNTWSPLANVILFGLLIATILTLFVIPSLFAVLDDIKGSRKKVNYYV